MNCISNVCPNNTRRIWWAIHNAVDLLRSSLYSISSECNVFSLIYPQKLHPCSANNNSKFKNLILSQVEKGKKFVIDTGGGRTCRKYQNVAREIMCQKKIL